jgi:hypothetical protein
MKRAGAQTRKFMREFRITCVSKLNHMDAVQLKDFYSHRDNMRCSIQENKSKMLQ